MTVSISTQRRRVEAGSSSPHVELRVYAGPDPEHRAYVGALRMREAEAAEFEARIQDTPIGHLDDDERRLLSATARYKAAEQEDPRYWHTSLAERERLLRRWLAIANMLHPDPYGEAEE